MLARQALSLEPLHWPSYRFSNQPMQEENKIPEFGLLLMK
jgi:hypothetical protein